MSIFIIHKDGSESKLTDFFIKRRKTKGIQGEIPCDDTIKHWSGYN